MGILTNLHYRILIAVCVVIHYVIFISIISLPLTAIVEGDWYLLAFSIFLIWWKAYGMPFDCPLSTLECYFERKAGLRPCRKFVKAWVSPENAKQNWKNLIAGTKYISNKTSGDY